MEMTIHEYAAETTDSYDSDIYCLVGMCDFADPCLYWINYLFTLSCSI